MEMNQLSKAAAPEIAALNSNFRMRTQAITVVYRADGSDTSSPFMQKLFKSDTELRSTVGAETSVEWSTNTGRRGRRSA